MLQNSTLWRHFQVSVPGHHINSKLFHYAQTNKAVRRLELWARLRPQDAAAWGELLEQQFVAILEAPFLDDVVDVYLFLRVPLGLAHRIFLLTCVALNNGDDRFMSLRDLTVFFWTAQLAIGNDTLAALADVGGVLCLASEFAGRDHPRAEPGLHLSLRQQTPIQLACGTLCLKGVFLEPNLYIPTAPSMVTLVLDHCVVGRNLYHLLEGAPGLRELQLVYTSRNAVDFTGDSQPEESWNDDTEEESPPLDSEDDDAGSRRIERKSRLRAQMQSQPIILSRLHTFYCTGPRSPCHWYGEPLHDGTREITMPNLRKAVLAHLPNLDPEPLDSSDHGHMWLDGDEGDPLCEPLQLLCMSSPRLEELDVSATSITDATMAGALLKLPLLRKLVVRDCMSLSNEWLCALVRYAPGLEELDMRDCFELTPQAAAHSMIQYRNSGHRLAKIWLSDPGPSSCFVPTLNYYDDYWSAKAYELLLWCDVAVVWQDHGLGRADLKRRYVFEDDATTNGTSTWT